MVERLIEYGIVTVEVEVEGRDLSSKVNMGAVGGDSSVFTATC